MFILLLRMKEVEQEMFITSLFYQYNIDHCQTSPRHCIEYWIYIVIRQEYQDQVDGGCLSKKSPSHKVIICVLSGSNLKPRTESSLIKEL